MLSVEFLRFGFLGAEERSGDLVLVSLSDVCAREDSRVSRGDVGKIKASTFDADRVGGERNGSSADGIGGAGCDAGDINAGFGRELVAATPVKVGVGLMSDKNADADSHRSLPFLVSALLMAKFCFIEDVLALSSTMLVIFLELIKFPMKDCKGEAVDF